MTVPVLLEAGCCKTNVKTSAGEEVGIGLKTLEKARGAETLLKGVEIVRGTETPLKGAETPLKGVEIVRGTDTPLKGV